MIKCYTCNEFILNILRNILNMILDRVVILCLATSLFASSSLGDQCDQFGYNSVCDLNDSNILGTILNLEDEIRCQSECQALPDCTHFSWIKLKSGK